MGIGGLAGGFGLAMGWGVIAENYAFNLTIGSGIGEAVQAGAQFLVSNSGIIFEGLGYTSAAGGGGFLTYEAIKGINNIDPSPKEPYWTAPNKLHSSESFALQQLMDLSYLTNKELIMLSLNDGSYWFEPFEGYSANHQGRYMQNTSSSSYVYTYWNTGSGGTYIQPNIFTRYYVNSLFHPHPRSYTVSGADRDIAINRRINVFAIGYDHSIHVAEGVSGYRHQVGYTFWDVLSGRSSLRNFIRGIF